MWLYWVKRARQTKTETRKKGGKKRRRRPEIYDRAPLFLFLALLTSAAPIPLYRHKEKEATRLSTVLFPFYFFLFCFVFGIDTHTLVGKVGRQTTKDERDQDTVNQKSNNLTGANRERNRYDISFLPAPRGQPHSRTAYLLSNTNSGRNNKTNGRRRRRRRKKPRPPLEWWS